jgi:RNA polymerase sigma-70 factor (ECF subfamily)
VSRIAINLCHDRLRKRREILADTLPEMVDEAPDQETLHVRSETSTQITEAISILPDRQKLALELVHFQEMSNIEAAKVMSISVDALESLLSRGRRKLKSLLSEHAKDLMSSYREKPTSHEGMTL